MAASTFGGKSLGLLGAIVLVPALGIGTARAVCPDDVCDCLGQAGQFAILGNTLIMQSGKQSQSGSAYYFPSVTDTSVCAKTGKFSGKPGGETEIGEDLLLTASSGLAATFKGYKYSGYSYEGVFIDGDLGTRGGTLKGLTCTSGTVGCDGPYAAVAGTTDTMAGNPRLPSCTQAMTDAQAASTTLAALAPTQTFDKVIVKDQDTFDIDAGPGTNVISIGQLTLKPQTYSGYAYGSFLSINLQDDTDSVIINVGKLQVGSACEIDVNGGDIENVIINVPGPGSSVKIKNDAVVNAAILAPGRKVLAKRNTFVANLFGSDVKIQGANFESLLCP